MIDMHIHTNNSDGELTVQELIQQITEKQIDVFSITDHDDVKSCQIIEQLLLPQNIKYIPGVEFSSYLEKYNCHILGYNINYNNALIQNECKKIKLRKYKKIKQVLEYIKKIHEISITQQEEMEILNKQGTIGRMDVCKLLVKKGYGSIPEIYNKYLTIPNLCNHRSEIDIIVNVIKDANGAVILAHPKKIEQDYKIEIEDIIEKFIDAGIDGIEIYNTIHTLQDVKKYLQIAKKYNLLTTGGSDFHGSTKPNRWLGYTTNEHIKIKKNQINFL